MLYHALSRDIYIYIATSLNNFDFTCSIHLMVCILGFISIFKDILVANAISQKTFLTLRDYSATSAV